jgi:transcriptional regulator with XRE-family HTH domain
MGKSEHKQLFMNRVREARERRGLTQDQIAKVLGMHQGTYHKYESRSYLPHDLIERFCLACAIDIDWLFTGQQRAASRDNVAVPQQKTQKARKLRASRRVA